MPRIICTLPNASESINGIRFTADRGQMLSDEVDQATAETFASIPGYAIAGTAPKPEPSGATAESPATAQKPAKPPKPPKPAATDATAATGAAEPKGDDTAAPPATEAPQQQTSQE